MLYYLIGDYTDVFGRALIFLLLYRVDLYLESIAAPTTTTMSFLQRFLIVICIVDMIAYCPLVLLSSVDIISFKIALCYRSTAYNITNLLILWITVKTIKLIDKFPRDFQKREWYSLIGGIFIYAVLRLGSTIYQLHAEYESSVTYKLYHAFATLIFNIVDTLLPCLIVLRFIVRILDAAIDGRTWSADTGGD
eukprot:TRINITY_DN9478_c0_g1_i6.p1 TRINITY_DN9478_c0_g1~~TRINITY_DN9478_c0_g1_i6.p1  ORF type:complete len:193 (+),score=22.05 TRINITY_DN9478_c0_g1_i6:142-720(+)